MDAAKVSDENSQVQKSSLELEGCHREDNKSNSITSTYSALMMFLSKEGT